VFFFCSSLTNINELMHQTCNYTLALIDQIFGVNGVQPIGMSENAKQLLLNSLAELARLPRGDRDLRCSR
jgi:hypothetical protein